LHGKQIDLAAGRRIARRRAVERDGEVQHRTLPAVEGGEHGRLDRGHVLGQHHAGHSNRNRLGEVRFDEDLDRAVGDAAAADLGRRPTRRAGDVGIVGDGDEPPGRLRQHVEEDQPSRRQPPQ
jgi:hypothetical protein